MSRYNILQAIPMSFFSRDLYRDVANRWNGKTFLYLLVIVALSWIAFTIQTQIAINAGYRDLSAKIVPQFPVITVKDGKMSTPENRPYEIKGPKNEVIGIIDTSGQYTTLDKSQIFLITSSEFITHSGGANSDQTKITRLPSNVNMVVDPVVVNHYIEKYLDYLWIIIFLVSIVFAYMLRLLQVVIYALIGKVFTAIHAVPLKYYQLLCISMVAITPALVLATVLDAFSVVFHFQYFLYFVITMLYLWFGIISNKTQVSETKD